jgi:predicted nucleic acid-binding protein
MQTSDTAVFIDTNILVYANVPEYPLHLVAINAIQSYEQSSIGVII